MAPLGCCSRLAAIPAACPLALATNALVSLVIRQLAQLCIPSSAGQPAFGCRPLTRKRCTRRGPVLTHGATAPRAAAPAAAVDLIVANEHVCEQMATQRGRGGRQRSSGAGKQSGRGQRTKGTSGTGSLGWVKVKSGASERRRHRHRSTSSSQPPTGAWFPACGRPAALPPAPGQSPGWAACR